MYEFPPESMRSARTDSTAAPGGRADSTTAH
jgi:hypothetical protein